MCVQPAFLLYMYGKPKFVLVSCHISYCVAGQLHTGLAGQSSVCYTIFTSRRLWGLALSEIYIENFEEQVNLIVQMGVWTTPDNFLFYPIALNVNFLILSCIEPFGNKNIHRSYYLSG